jgi:hypothetical protein
VSHVEEHMNFRAAVSLRAVSREAASSLCDLGLDTTQERFVCAVIFSAELSCAFGEASVWACRSVSWEACYTAASRLLYRGSALYPNLTL